MDPGSADTVPRRPHHRIRWALPAAYSAAPPEHHPHYDAVAHPTLRAPHPIDAPDPRSARYAYERGAEYQGTVPTRYAVPTRCVNPHELHQHYHDARAAEYYSYYDARAAEYHPSAHPPAHYHNVASQSG